MVCRSHVVWGGRVFQSTPSYLLTPSPTLSSTFLNIPFFVKDKRVTGSHNDQNGFFPYVDLKSFCINNPIYHKSFSLILTIFSSTGSLLDLFYYRYFDIRITLK